MSFTCCQVNDCGRLCDGYLPLCDRHEKFVSSTALELAKQAERKYFLNGTDETRREMWAHAEGILAQARSVCPKPKKKAVRP